MGNWEEVVKKVGLLKRNCFASVFEKYFEFQEQGEEGHKRAVIHYRDEETLYVEARADRVTVVFSTVFRDEDDIILGKVFLQELREGRRASHSSSSFVQSPRTSFGTAEHRRQSRRQYRLHHIRFVPPSHEQERTREHDQLDPLVP